MLLKMRQRRCIQTYKDTSDASVKIFANMFLQSKKMASIYNIEVIFLCLHTYLLMDMVLHTKKSEGGLKVADEKKIVKAKAQNLILENREKLSITGVIDVESFNDECVVIDTELGILIIRGEDLRINKLNIDNSELNIEGDIYLLEYSDKDGSRSKGGFFGKMFR